MSDGDKPTFDSSFDRHEQGFALGAPRFVGREDERRALAQLLTDRENGPTLITLTGPPGIGKTRLARRALCDAEAPVRLFCDLSAARTPQEFVAAVADALNLTIAAARDLDEATDTVGRALQALAEPVLVLDNFEQLQDDAARLVRLQALAPQAKILVTSRHRLRLEGETVVDVPPLALADAVTLFEERARPGLGRGLQDNERDAAQRLCAHLDGIPLAIELAAARAAVLSVNELSQRVLTDLHVLEDARPDRSPRQHSARAAVAWSWELLTAPEREALAQASQFVRGFTLEAAEAVLVGSGARVIDLVQGLRERSLLWARREGVGPVRFGLFEIVRDFAHAELQKDTAAAEAVALRHARFFVDDASTHAALLASGHPWALERLLALADDLVAAFRATIVDSGDDAFIARAALALVPVIRRRGSRDLHEEVIDRGLLAARRHGLAEAEFELTQAQAALASTAGDVRVARAGQERAVVLAQSLDDEGRLSFAEARLGWDRFELGEVDEGIAAIREAAARAAKAADHEREAYAHDRLGLALLERGGRGDVDEALATLWRATTLAAHRASPWLRHKVQTELAHALRVTGDCAAATRLLDDTGPAVDVFGEAFVATERGALARLQGNLDLALLLADTAVRKADAASAPRLMAQATLERALVLHDLGALDMAQRALDDALRAAARVENGTFRARVLQRLALLRQERADLDGAKAALAEAKAALAGGRFEGLLRALLLDEALLELEGGAALDVLGKRLREATQQAAEVGGRAAVAALSTLAAVDAEAGPAALARARALMARVGDVESHALLDVAHGHEPSDASALVPAVARRALRLLRQVSRRVLVVADDGRAYAVDGRRVNLARQRSMRLILMALVDRAEATPGRGVTQVEVLEAGWPGEKMRPASGAARVYTAVRRLRRGGLEGVIVTRDDGYLLDPNVRIHRVRDAAE